ncbi:hypothetical protein CsSME_00007877 [Camellia sinensis var. sinensis]
MDVTSFSLILITFLSLSSPCFAEIRFTEIRSDDRPIIPFDEFGFTNQGRLELNVSQISLSNPSPDLDRSKLGFFLCTRASWPQVLQQIEDAEINCALHSTLIKKVYIFDSLNTANSFDTLYLHKDADQYTLVFANCLPQMKVSMNVRSAMYNLDAKTNRRDYLSAGRTVLPTVYFLSV